MSEFRYNKLAKEWVLFAPNRAKRPTQNIVNNKINNKECPFDESHEYLTPNELIRIGDEKNWKCRIVPNLYNALNIDDPIESKRDGCFEKKSGFGAHEVIIETPEHFRSMFEFNINEFYDYLSIIKLRLLDLKKDLRINYFSVFKNHGIDAGASQPHSHSQIIATPFIPKSISKNLQEYSNYKKKHDRDFFDDIIFDEKNFKKGILFENSTFIAFCPYASKYPFEILIISKDKIASIIDCEDTHIYALAEVLEFVYKKLYNALGDFSFNMLFKNGDIQNKNNSNRFHLQITPRLYRIAGFELDSDIFINTFLPEKATQILLQSKEN